MSFDPVREVWNMAAYPRDDRELLAEAKKQLKFLKDHCGRYDAGDPDYGSQIAVPLRVLLHDTKQSHSVLRQLEQRFFFSAPDFLDLSSVGGDLPNKGKTSFVRSSLIQYQMDHREGSSPILTVLPLAIENGRRYPFRAFKTWWEKLDVILVDDRNFINRKKAVLLLANKDGGAYLDPEMDETLMLLNRRLALPLRIFVPLPGGGQREYTAPVKQILSAAARTIAAEALYMFENRIIPECEAQL